jgi:hypothetical protein
MWISKVILYEMTSAFSILTKFISQYFFLIQGFMPALSLAHVTPLAKNNTHLHNPVANALNMTPIVTPRQ